MDFKVLLQGGLELRDNNLTGVEELALTLSEEEVAELTEDCESSLASDEDEEDPAELDFRRAG